MDLNARMALNMQVLRRSDPNVDAIMYSAKHVVLYELVEVEDEQGSAWKRMSVEGPLFIIRRSTHPHHRLIVLNRHSDGLFTEDLCASEDFQFESTQNTVLYQNTRGFDRGIWFYDEKEMRSFVETIRALQLSSLGDLTKKATNSVSETKHVAPTASNQSPDARISSASEGQPDIRSMANMSNLLSPNDFYDRTEVTPSSGWAFSKLELKERLLALLNDDAFLSALHTEYINRLPNNARADLHRK